KNGFTANQQNGSWNFVPPCLFYGSITMGGSPDKTKEKSAENPPKQALLIFICMPVSPGNSRLIFATPRNFALWIDPFVSRWMHHIG
nr:protochlorophyllide-dependent translocon component 52, chloroplastic-like [Tanacetum cinerariifolium]